jgi:hypothetical protein
MLGDPKFRDILGANGSNILHCSERLAGLRLDLPSIMPRSKPHLLEQNDEWTVRGAPHYMTLGRLEKWVLLIPSRKDADNDFASFRFDSLTFTPRRQPIGVESNFSRCSLIGPVSDDPAVSLPARQVDQLGFTANCAENHQPSYITPRDAILIRHMSDCLSCRGHDFLRKRQRNTGVGNEQFDFKGNGRRRRLRGRE